MMARRWKFWGRSIFRRSGKFGMTRRMKSQNQKWRRTRVFYLLQSFRNGNAYFNKKFGLSSCQCEGGARVGLTRKEDICATETFEYLLHLRQSRTCAKASCKQAKLNHAKMKCNMLHEIVLRFLCG